MKATKTLLKIQSFKNPAGSTSWRVHGYFKGQRIRKNFSSKEEAMAEKNAMTIQLMQTESGMRPTVSLLSDPQLREAELTFEMIKGLPRSLTFYVQYALANHKEPEQNLPLAEAIAMYRTARMKDYDDGVISKEQFRTIKQDMAKLQAYFPRRLVSELDAEILRSYFARGKVGKKTFNNRRGIVSTFMKYAHEKKWIVENPVLSIPHYKLKHKRGSAETITAKQAAELMEYVEHYMDGRLVPVFALCLFAGIRPDVQAGEIFKLKHSDINLNTGVIHVEPEVSKVDMKRNVRIQPNLDAWLRAYPLDKYPIRAANIERLKTRVAKKFNLGHDVLRHTFISMHVAKFRSMGDTALQAGNSEEIIRKHYLDIKSPAEAEEFFNIMPSKSSPLRNLPPADTEAWVWKLQQSNPPPRKHSQTLLVCA